MRHRRVARGWRARTGAVLAAVGLLAGPGVAAAQDPTVTADPPPSTSTTSTLPGPIEPTTTVDPTAVLPADPPPIDEGAEIPDPTVDSPPPPGTAAPAVPTGAAPSSDPAVLAEQRRIAGLIERRGDAAAVGREIEAAAVADLDRADAALAAARADYEAVEDQRASADAAAAQARTDAAEARARAESASEALQEVAVAMYLDPPGDLSAAALDGEVGDRIAVSALLSARSESVRRAQLRAEAAERAAETEERAARASALEADTAVAAAERQLQELQSDVAARTAAVAQVRITLAAAQAEVDGLILGGSLAARLSVDAVTASGSVLVDVAADGSWSVVPVGFPAPSDIVRLPGTTIRVHRLIAAQVQALLAAAAADGLRLDGWGHRDAMSQVNLRRSHCGGSYEAVFTMPSSSCRPPTARPGRSMHERGLAIDFANCSARSTACYQWLAANASRYGLFNLPSEPWHWSTNAH
jgi:LAS superfamily LD-carboxypeptidase LdcB